MVTSTFRKTHKRVKRRKVISRKSGGMPNGGIWKQKKNLVWRDEREIPECFKNLEKNAIANRADLNISRMEMGLPQLPGKPLCVNALNRSIKRLTTLEKGPTNRRGKRKTSKFGKVGSGNKKNKKNATKAKAKAKAKATNAKATNAKEPAICNICHSPTTNKTRITATCGHVSCRECLSQWVDGKASPTCPLCRGDIKPEQRKLGLGNSCFLPPDDGGRMTLAEL
jgi:hypothetical protein